MKWIIALTALLTIGCADTHNHHYPASPSCPEISAEPDSVRPDKPTWHADHQPGEAYDAYVSEATNRR